MSYEQGFIEKCAEFGVDPDALVKEAARGDIFTEAIARLAKLAPDAPMSHRGAFGRGLATSRGTMPASEVLRNFSGSLDDISERAGKNSIMGYTQPDGKHLGRGVPTFSEPGAAASLFADPAQRAVLGNNNKIIPGLENLGSVYPEHQRSLLADRLKEIRKMLKQYGGGSQP